MAKLMVSPRVLHRVAAALQTTEPLHENNGVWYATCQLIGDALGLPSGHTGDNGARDRFIRECQRQACQRTQINRSKIGY